MEYIYEIYKKQKTQDMQLEFDKKFNMMRARVDVLPDLEELRITVVDGMFKYIKSYIATDYDCVPMGKEVPKLFKDLPKSSISFNDEEMKKFYLDYMKKNFKSYEKDYNDNQNTISNDNLNV